MAVTLSVLAGGPRAGSAGRLHTRTGSGTLHEQVDSKRLLYMLTATQGPKNRTRARRPVPSSLVGWVGSQQPHTSKPAIDLLTYINAQLIGMLAIHCRLICSNQATRERVPFVLCFIEHPEEGRG